MKDLTILKFISDFQAKNGYSPSLKNIYKCTGLSSSSVAANALNRLENRGLICQPRNADGNRLARALIITDAGRKALND